MSIFISFIPELQAVGSELAKILGMRRNRVEEKLSGEKITKHSLAYRLSCSLKLSVWCRFLGLVMRSNNRPINKEDQEVEVMTLAKHGSQVLFWIQWCQVCDPKARGYGWGCSIT